MSFVSLQFFFFFIVVAGLYFSISHRYRWALLLIASCYFYMAFIPIYILILGFTIVVDYFAGIAIEGASGKRRKLFLIFSLLANIGVLAVFKYYNFINNNISFLLNYIGMGNPLPFLSMLLPIGLSFHTFQAMSYTIEVYRGKQKAERHFGIYALYVMFFPQLVCGPIERPQNLIHQFREKHVFDYDRIISGLRLMLWGFFKKTIIADRLGVFVDKVFSNPHHISGVNLTLAAIFFSYQIYCDFSGYSDIAVGAARVLGIKLMKNFRSPYHAKSFSEYWTRWHISLSTWFREYLYIPLGGNRGTVSRMYFNLFIVFLVGGLWHGANWTFIIWGALNGLFLIASLILKPLKKLISNFLRLPGLPFISIATVFCFGSLARIFFRADHVKDAFYILTHLFYGWTDWSNYKLIQVLDNQKFNILTLFGLIFLLEIIENIQDKWSITELFNKQPVAIRWSAYFVMVFAICAYGILSSRQPFIYFQF